MIRSLVSGIPKIQRSQSCLGTVTDRYYPSEALTQRICQVLKAAAASSAAGLYTHAEKVSIRLAVIQMMSAVEVKPGPPPPPSLSHR